MKHEDEQASEAMRAISQIGAPKGGRARAEKLSPARRRQIAQKAARTRWQNQPGRDKPVTTMDDDDETLRAKGIIDGATTLAEAAEMVRAFAAELQKLHGEGYVLREPVEDDYVFYYKSGT
jgi:beta-lactamase class A